MKSLQRTPAACYKQNKEEHVYQGRFVMKVRVGLKEPEQSPNMTSAAAAEAQ